jgi:hypothetical protein
VEQPRWFEGILPGGATAYVEECLMDILGYCIVEGDRTQYWDNYPAASGNLAVDFGTATTVQQVVHPCSLPEVHIPQQQKEGIPVIQLAQVQEVHDTTPHAPGAGIEQLQEA